MAKLTVDRRDVRLTLELTEVEAFALSTVVGFTSERSTDVLEKLYAAFYEAGYDAMNSKNPFLLREGKLTKS